MRTFARSNLFVGRASVSTRRRVWGRGVAPVAVFALVALFLVAIPGVAAAADLEDLFFDLQVVPLGEEEAPGFILESLEGRRVSLAEFRGRPVLLYFWATW